MRETPAMSRLKPDNLNLEEWYILTVEELGLKYHVAVQSKSEEEATTTFEEEYSCFDVGIYDSEYEQHQETVYARQSNEAAEIALEREREYMKAYDIDEFENDAIVLTTIAADETDGVKPRKALRDAAAVRE